MNKQMNNRVNNRVNNPLQTTDHTQQTSMSVTEDQPNTSEQVETCTVTADTETGTNPTQHSRDLHETVASVTQCL